MFSVYCLLCCHEVEEGEGKEEWKKGRGGRGEASLIKGVGELFTDRGL